MSTAKDLNIEIPLDCLAQAVRKMKKKDRESFIEDFIALTSPEYLESVKEARADYKTGRTKTHQDIFGQGR